MILTGYALRVEHDLTPEQIIAPAYATSGDPALLAAHCLEAVDASLAETAREGDILVVNGRLHTGAGAEEALVALQALGIAAVVCARTDNALARLAGTFGLPILAQEEATTAIPPGSIVRLDLARGAIAHQPSGTTWRVAPCAPGIIAAVQRTQLLARMRRVVEEEGFAE